MIWLLGLTGVLKRQSRITRRIKVAKGSNKLKEGKGKPKLTTKEKQEKKKEKEKAKGK